MQPRRAKEVDRRPSPRARVDADHQAVTARRRAFQVRGGAYRIAVQTGLIDIDTLAQHREGGDAEGVIIGGEGEIHHALTDARDSQPRGRVVGRGEWTAQIRRGRQHRRQGVASRGAVFRERPTVDECAGHFRHGDRPLLGDIDVAGRVHRHAGGVGKILRHCDLCVASHGPFHDLFGSRIRHINIARNIHRHANRIAQTGERNRGGGAGGGRPFQNRGAPGIGDINVAGSVHSDADRVA